MVKQQDSVLPYGPKINDASATTLPPGTCRYAHLSDAASTANYRTPPRVGEQLRLKTPVFLITQKVQDLPGEDGRLDDFHYMKYTPLADSRKQDLDYKFQLVLVPR